MLCSGAFTVAVWYLLLSTSSFTVALWYLLLSTSSFYSGFSLLWQPILWLKSKPSQIELRATNTHLSEFELSIQACIYNEFWIAWSVCLASIIEHLILALCMRFFYSKLILYTYVCMCACRERERERERERIYSSRFINMCAQVLDLKSNTFLFCTL